ncbi:hypothetical protein E5288_WYG019708 [Bos mutus]|uniref:Uncharacterized protein n=1 Tax=Bos mutus TaxID=72004 RepID=A0A6B0S603_9CETA|nr:hypothetical protein [Bos mutus]
MEKAASGMPGTFRTALSPGFAVGDSLLPGRDAPFCLWRLVVSERQAQQVVTHGHAKNRTCVLEALHGARRNFPRKSPRCRHGVRNGIVKDGASSAR